MSIGEVYCLQFSFHCVRPTIYCNWLAASDLECKWQIRISLETLCCYGIHMYHFLSCWSIRSTLLQVYFLAFMLFSCLMLSRRLSFTVLEAYKPKSSSCVAFWRMYTHFICGTELTWEMRYCLNKYKKSAQTENLSLSSLQHHWDSLKFRPDAKYSNTIVQVQ